MFGEWKYGFLSMILVGAMNVGTIALNFDKVNFFFKHQEIFKKIGTCNQHQIEKEFHQKLLQKIQFERGKRAPFIISKGFPI